MRPALQPFDGPLDLLLRLIEQEELDITTVALAGVCESYLAHLKQVEQRTPEAVADFLVIAAKLLYLKSLVLLPEAEGDAEEDETGLAAQLRIYRAFAEAATGIAEQFSVSPRMHPSARVPVIVPSFLPPKRVDLAMLGQVMVHLIAELEPIVRIPKATIGRTISIEDRIAELRALVAARSRVTLHDVLRGRTGRREQIVSFLAVLELVRQQEVVAIQSSQFSPIAIERSSDGRSR
ncbi:MAG: segregation/condensation protein A [bacterium]|nr:segregation/condensation protein A [bacterium]